MNLDNPLSKSVKCKKCGLDNLGWDMEYNTNTGNWRLGNPNTEMPHECKTPKPPEPRKMVFCPRLFCGRTMKDTELQNHLKKEHIDWGDYL